ncbi:unnamed protein product [Pylaiella littoralis]
MDEVVRLKSRFVSSRPDEGSAGHKGSDGGATRLVEGILRRKSFYFQQRTGKLDMRAIGRVAVDDVINDVDIDTLQAHLENITFANVSEDDLRLYSDQCFLNLFRLSQLLLEYLLSVQDTLATSLEALAVKHDSVRKALDRGRAELHAASEQDRALKREVRQKRATIARYEQLLALPVPPPERGTPKSGDGDGKLHSCLTCGKMFTTAEFLQQHIVRKHAQRNRSTSNTNSGEEEKTAFPAQLRLFVQTSTGQCLDMMVQGGATVAQLRGYINSTAGFEAAGPSTRLLYRGMQLHDDQSLRECNIQTDSQLLLLHTESVTAGDENVKGADEEIEATAARESATTKQVSTLVDLMRQQMEWSMKSESSRREQDLGSVEALETRMRGIEASLPRRLEEFMEESVGGLKTSLRKALDDMGELHVKRSNAGAIQDDEEETRRKEEKEKLRLAALSADVERVSRENAALLEELAKVKAAQAAASIATETHPVAPTVEVIAIAKEPPRQQVSNPSSTPIYNPARNTSMWELNFPAESSRQAVVVEVSKTATCETVCESIAAQLDVADARVVIRDKRGAGAMVALEMLSSELQDLYEGGFLKLEVLQGHVISDNVVDGLVDFYEQHVPVKARDSAAVSRSMAEIDLAAKRHAIAGRKGQGADDEGLCGGGENGGEDATVRAEKQVEGIRAQLSATLAGGRFSAKNTDLSQSVSISRTTPGLGLLTAGSGNNNSSGAGNGIGEDDIFGDAAEDSSRLSLAELERTVSERKRTRPPGIERQMESVSKSVEDQLSLLLEEAEEELQQLEQDSLGSETYSSTDPSENAAVSAFADAPWGNNLAPNFPETEVENSRARGSGKQSNRKLSVAGTAARRRSERVGGGRLEDEDIPKSDWGRTLDTAVSIPEGPEERADEHEANASLEHALGHGTTSDGDDSMVLVAEKSGVDTTALDASVESWRGRP